MGTAFGIVLPLGAEQVGLQPQAGCRRYLQQGGIERREGRRIFRGQHD